MPIRNPFARRPGLVVNDENARPASPATSLAKDANPGFERVDTVGSSKASSSAALSIRSAKSLDTGEYKMSVVNDSGVYLPPSPVEKEAMMWPRRYISRQSSDSKRSRDGIAGAGSGEIEHFPISRESFDSYRRSFDISARSPIPLSEPTPRQSLDSYSPRFPRTHLPAALHSSNSNSSSHSHSHSHNYSHRSSALAERRQPEESSGFEDVGLTDENRSPNPNPTQNPTYAAAPAKKKMSFFSKFGLEDSGAAPPSPPPTIAEHQHQHQHHQGIASRFLPGRKRGQSVGQGAELGAMPLGGDRPKVVGGEV